MARAVFRFFGAIHIFVYRLTSGRIAGRVAGLRVLLLTTTGRTSGRKRTVPLGCLKEGEAYIVIASNAGFDVHPGWFHNLRAEPRVQIQVGAALMEARARVIEGDERSRLWSRVVSLSPGYSIYERRTRRVIPLVALHPTR
jgi:deazaflavin-dependent oxidoreductase (nitroreductase family)